MSEQEKQKQQKPYVIQALALGLNFETPVETIAKTSPRTGVQGARRSSLSQRLGLSKGKEADVDSNKDTDTAATVESHKSSEDSLSISPTLQSPSAQKTPKQRTAKVECVEAVGEDLYVGTSDGQIVHYTVEMPDLKSSAVPEHFKVQSVDLNMNRKRIEQMIAFPALSKLVVLCNSTILFYSLPELRPTSMAKINGVSCVASDERVQRATATTAVLCVARMRSIQVYRMGSDLRLEQEVPIQNSVASICQYGNFLCVADSETYKILDLAKMRTAPDTGQLILLPTQQPTTDPKSGKIVRPPRPRTLVVGPNEFMFLTSSGDETTLGVIVTAMGEALRGTLQFESFPKSIVYDDPYAVAVFANGTVEIYDTRQTEPTLVQRVAAVDLGIIGKEQAAKRPRRLCAVSGVMLSTNIAQLEVIDDDVTTQQSEQPQVVEPPVVDLEGLFRTPDEAPASSGSKNEELDTSIWAHAQGMPQHTIRREIVTTGSDSLTATHSLSRLMRSGIVLVTQDSLYALSTEPLLDQIDQLIDSQKVEQALELVEKALASDVSLDSRALEVKYCFQKAGLVCLKNMLFDDALAHFMRGNLDPRSLVHLFPEYVEYLQSLIVPLARVPLAAGVRAKLAEISSINELVRMGASQLAGSEMQTDTLREALERNSRDLLARYLEHVRVQMDGEQMAFSPDSLPVIDTLLVRVYAEDGDRDKVCALIETQNSIVVDFAARYFIDTNKYYYASQLYRFTGERAELLAMWKKLITGEWADTEFGGISEYLDYLHTLRSNQDLLLDEFYWFVERADVHALTCILADLSDAAVARLDADRVIRGIEPTGDDLLRVFIERLLAAGHARTKHYMTYLLKAYVRQLHAMSADSLDALDVGFRCAQAENLDLTMRAYLRTLTGSEAGTLRVRVLKILEAVPVMYDPQSILECIAEHTSDTTPEFMNTEKAVLLVVLRRTNDAVEFLVNDVGDYAEAELLLLRKNCPDSLARLFSESADVAANVRRLLSMYLALSDDEMAARLVASILDRYGQLLDPSVDVLPYIPAHWPLDTIGEFVVRCLCKLESVCRATQIECNVRQARAFDEKIEAAQVMHNAPGVRLEYSQGCAKCGRLLGSSAFVYSPVNKGISHVSCLDEEPDDAIVPKPMKNL